MNDRSIPTGKITTRDIYHAISELSDQVTAIKVSMEHISTRNAAADQIHTDHEARLRGLEAFKWKMIGMASVIPLVEGVIAVLIAWKVR